MKLNKGFVVAAAALLMGCPAKSGDGGDDVGVSAGSSGAVTTAATSSSGGDDGSSGSNEGGGETTTGASATSGSSTSGMSGECQNGGRCMPQPPDGWMGPIATYHGLADGSDVPTCDDQGFDSPGLTMLEGYNDPGPAQCDCSCGVNLAAYCNMYVTDYASGCLYVNQANIGTDCQAFTIDNTAVFYMYAGGVASCQAEKTTTLPEVQWDARVSSCAGADQSQECAEGGFCTPLAPAGYQSELCVFAQGDMDCPADTYTEKYTVYNGADDTRNCGVCFCGTGTATCAGSLDTFLSTDCSGAVLENVPQNGSCTTPAGAGANSVQVNFTGTDSCPVDMPPEPTGEINPGTAFTYCCEAPA